MKKKNKHKHSTPKDWKKSTIREDGGEKSQRRAKELMESARKASPLRGRSAGAFAWKKNGRSKPFSPFQRVETNAQGPITKEELDGIEAGNVIPVAASRKQKNSIKILVPEQRASEMRLAEQARLKALTPPTKGMNSNPGELILEKALVKNIFKFLVFGVLANMLRGKLKQKTYKKSINRSSRKKAA